MNIRLAWVACAHPPYTSPFLAMLDDGTLILILILSLIIVVVVVVAPKGTTTSTITTSATDTSSTFVTTTATTTTLTGSSSRILAVNFVSCVTHHFEPKYAEQTSKFKVM